MTKRTPVEREWARLLTSERRQAAGYRTQQDLADALGVSQPTVSSWEHGLRAPHVSMWARVANALGLADNELDRVYRALGRGDAA